MPTFTNLGQNAVQLSLMCHVRLKVGANLPCFLSLSSFPCQGTELKGERNGCQSSKLGKKGEELAAVGQRGIQLILDLACKSGESQDRAFYHDPLFVSHAQHLQTVQAGLPFGLLEGCAIGRKKGTTSCHRKRCCMLQHFTLSILCILDYSSQIDGKQPGTSHSGSFDDNMNSLGNRCHLRFHHSDLCVYSCTTRTSES